MPLSIIGGVLAGALSKKIFGGTGKTAQAAVSSYLGNRQSQRQARSNFDYQLSQQHRYNQLGQQASIDRALGLGLTPQELAGSTLGNAPGNSANLGWQSNENALDRERDIKVAEIQAATQLGTAEISAGPGHRQAQIAENLESLRAAVLNNEIKTGSPQFLERMKLATMGMANVAGTAFVSRFKSVFGFDPVFDVDGWSKLSPRQAAQAIGEMLGMTSPTLTNIQGLDLTLGNVKGNVPLSLRGPGQVGIRLGTR